jgi:hypothetical protein
MLSGGSQRARLDFVSVADISSEPVYFCWVATQLI